MSYLILVFVIKCSFDWNVSIVHSVKTGTSVKFSLNLGVEGKSVIYFFFKN